MKNKKMLLALALVLTLGSTLVAGGSLAWFSDTDEATNTFTVGSVEIEQVEDFVKNSELIPVRSNDTPDDDPNFIKKEVSVRNTGKNPAYLQTFIAVPAALDLTDGPLRLYLGNDTDWSSGDKIKNVSITFGNDGTNLTQVFNIYTYRYNTPLAAGDETSNVLSGVYIDEKTDLQINRSEADPDVIESAYLVWGGNALVDFDLMDNDEMKLHVLVATQAIQSQGFENAADAFGSGAFPAHPWA